MGCGNIWHSKVWIHRSLRTLWDERSCPLLLTPPAPPPAPVKGSRSDLLDDDVEDSAAPENMHCRPQDPPSPYLLATRQITRVKSQHNSAKEALGLLETTDIEPEGAAGPSKHVLAGDRKVRMGLGTEHPGWKGKLDKVRTYQYGCIKDSNTLLEWLLETWIEWR